MASLKLIQLQCNLTEDLTGPDEPELRLNGNTIWTTRSINDGQTLSLLNVPPIPFTDPSTVQLIDRDVPPLDPDDVIGGNGISTTLPLNVQFQMTFALRRANYVLTYEIV